MKISSIRKQNYLHRFTSNVYFFICICKYFSLVTIYYFQFNWSFLFLYTHIYISYIVYCLFYLSLYIYIYIPYCFRFYCYRAVSARKNRIFTQPSLALMLLRIISHFLKEKQNTHKTKHDFLKSCISKS